jgi:hypothetical protein
VGEHREGDVPVPGVIASYLIVVQTYFGFGGLEAFLDCPPVPCNTNQVVIGNSRWGATQAVSQFVFDFTIGRE